MLRFAALRCSMRSGNMPSLWSANARGLSTSYDKLSCTKPRAICGQPFRTPTSSQQSLSKGWTRPIPRHISSTSWLLDRKIRDESRTSCKATADAAQPSKSGTDFKILQFISQQFLPLALLLGMTLGYFFPESGVRASSLQLQTWTTTGIFIISGLGMRRGETMQALSSWGSFLFGMLSILVITPLAALVALRLPLQPPELAFGLAVFCCMPTTLSSGVSLTQAVGGNTALALLLTVGSNLLGIFTMPFVLCTVLGSGQGAVQISPGPLLASLLKTILAPLLLGVAARAFVPGMAARVDKNKKQLGRLSAVLLAMVPWMQISKAVADQISVEPSSLAAAVVAGLLIHTVFLGFNLAAVNVLKLGGTASHSKGLQRAVVLVASQKTLPIAIAVLAQLATFIEGPMGLATIPCVAAHLGQIVIDSMLITSWMNKDRQLASKSS